jgi:hypothetical protein
MSDKSIPDRPFSPRSALIMLMAAFVGENAGLLTFAVHRSFPEAVLAGGAAAGAAILALVRLIGS